MFHTSLSTSNLFPFIRFKYENSGKLTDTSSPPSLLQSVHQLIEVSQNLFFIICAGQLAVGLSYQLSTTLYFVIIFFNNFAKKKKRWKNH